MAELENCCCAPASQAVDARVRTRNHSALSCLEIKPRITVNRINVRTRRPRSSQFVTELAEEQSFFEVPMLLILWLP
jgi:hypothetical protein